MRNNILTLTTALLLILTGTEVSASGAPGTTENKGGYAPIHGMQLYYEIHGQGKPMVLLHGGITAFEGFGTTIDALAKSRQVIAVHLQGHGNTADIDRPYRFEALADDVAALVAYLKLGKIDLVGYSFGGGVALQTAIRHPEIVDRMVVISSVMAQSGFYPEVLAAFAQMSKNAPMLADNVKRSPLATMYPKTNWETSFKKMGELNSTPFDWSAHVKALKLPTLLEVGGKLIAMAEDYPENKYDLKPTPAQRTFAEQLQHAAGASYYFTNPVMGQKPPAGEDSKREQYKTKADIVAFIKKLVADGAAALQSKGEKA